MITYKVYTSQAEATCTSDRVPVFGEVFEFVGEDWTVGIIRWEPTSYPTSNVTEMMAHITLYKDASKGQGPIYHKPPLGRMPPLNDEGDLPF